MFASANWKIFDKTDIATQFTHQFARNRLVIVTGLSRSLTNDAQLVKIPSLVLADKSVPAGNYAEQYLRACSAKFGQAWYSQVKSHVRSYETDVRQVLQKIVLGEGDGGIVYQSDAQSAGSKINSFPVNPKFGPIAKYPIGIPTESAQVLGARYWISLVLSRFGQARLKQFGFLSK